jgi:alginate O-acetyltransferase complex protein AlgI
LVTLFLFRYLDFTLTTVNAGPATRDVLGLFLAVTLPAGISFYTFQIMSYSLDVAGNDVEREKSLLSLSTYLVLFPQLIAGPIVRYPEVKEQIARLAT